MKRERPRRQCASANRLSLACPFFSVMVWTHLFGGYLMRMGLARRSLVFIEVMMIHSVHSSGGATCFADVEHGAPPEQRGSHPSILCPHGSAGAWGTGAFLLRCVFRRSHSHIPGLPAG